MLYRTRHITRLPLTSNLFRVAVLYFPCAGPRSHAHACPTDRDIWAYQRVSSNFTQPVLRPLTVTAIQVAVHNAC